MTSLLRSFLALFFIFSMISTSAATLEPPTLATYAALPSITDMTISPSGNLVAYRKAEGTAQSLVIFSLKESKLIRAINLADLDFYDASFVSDDYLVLRIAQNKFILGFIGRMDVSTAFSIDIKSGKMIQMLTPGKGIYQAQSGLGSIKALSPDGQFAYMTAFVAEHKKDYDPNYSLVRVPIGKKKSPKVIEKGSPHTNDYFLNSKAEVIAEEIFDDTKDIFKIRVPDGKAWRTVYKEETKIPPYGIYAVASDDKNLIVKSINEQGFEDFYTFSTVDGSLTPLINNTTNNDARGVLVGRNRIATGISFDSFKASYKFFDKKMQTRFEKIAALFTDQSVIFVESSEKGDIIVLVTGSAYTGDYFLFSSNSYEPRFLASQYPSIKPEQIHPIGRVDFKASDGFTIPTLITIPNTKVSNMKNLPAVLLPHGGPESMDRIRFDWLAQAIANEGYLVIQPQFRGSSGFGRPHTEAGFGEWGKKMQSDLTEAVDFLSNKGIIDPHRVCIAGASYGGYAALAGGAFTPNKFQCVVSINGVSDLPKMISTEKRDHGSDSWVVDYWKRFLDDGDANRATLKKLSPTNFTKSFVAPVLLLHSEEDSVVYIEQSELMHKKLQKAGKLSTFIELPEDQHWLKHEASRVTILTSMIPFINQHIGPSH